MCLTIKELIPNRVNAKNPKPLIAKEDIRVWKGLHMQTTRTGITPHQNFQFEKGQHYYQEGNDFTFKVGTKTSTYVNGKVVRGYEVSVYEGLHACTTRSKAFDHAPWVVPMTIPKGARYFLGKKGDIVSNQLIWR